MVCGDERLAKQAQLTFCVLVDQQLIRVRAPLVTHGHGLASPDQLCAAGAEVFPTSDSGVSGSAINRAIPAFHRMNAKAVTDLLTIKRDWLSERTLAAGIRLRCRREFDSPRLSTWVLKSATFRMPPIGV